MPQQKNSKIIKKIKGSIKTYRSRLNNNRYKNRLDYPAKIKALEYKLGELEGGNNYENYLVENDDVIINSVQKDDPETYIKEVDVVKMNETVLERQNNDDISKHDTKIKEHEDKLKKTFPKNKNSKSPIMKKIRKFVNVILFEDLFE